MNDVQREILNNTLQNLFARPKTDFVSAQMPIVQPKNIVAECEMYNVELEMVFARSRNYFAECKTAIVALYNNCFTAVGKI